VVTLSDTPTIAHPQEREIWLAVAAAVAPREQRRPSTWMEENIVLDAKQTSRPGPVNMDHKPWSRKAADRLYDHPEKKGIIAPKPSQIGFSYLMIFLLLWLMANKPGPILYVTDIQPKAIDYKLSVFAPLVANCPEVRGMLLGDDGKRGRDLVSHAEYSGGAVDFVGAGSEAGVTSQGRQDVFLDEFAAAAENYHEGSKGGDLWVTALGRFPEYKESSGLYCFSHPRFPDEDIDAKFKSLSDQAQWTFLCPHAECGQVVFPSMACLHFEGTKADGVDDEELDPDKAVFRCPCCNRVISDAERARATWPAEKGGTGDFRSPLPDDVAARREYLGCGVNRLADPHVTVREIAGGYVSAKAAGGLQSFFNKTLGEVYRIASVAITVSLIEQRFQRMPNILLPGGPMGAHFLVAGVDVQKGNTPDNPAMVVVTAAYTGSGMQLITDLVKIKGWAALWLYLREYKVHKVDHEGRQGEAMGLELCVIDCGNWTSQVLDNSRISNYSVVTGGRVKMLPVRFRPNIRPPEWAVMPPLQKRTDPIRPHLGALDRYDLHRHTCVDRAMRRWTDGRVRVLCETPGDFANQCSSNVLVPIKNMTTYEDTQEEEWVKIKDRRDDWLMAQVYNEVGAVLEYKLDEIHFRAAAMQGDQAAEVPAMEVRRSWIDGGRIRSGGWWGQR